MGQFETQKQYLTYAFMRHRNKSLPIENDKYRFMDTTGLYPGFKENKTSRVVMCSCIKNALKKDINMLNKTGEYYVKKDDLFSYDIIVHFAPLLPKDVFKNIDFKMLMEFQYKNNIDVDRLLKYIIFEDRICRLCNVEDGESKSLTKEEFLDFKLFYKHQVMNELDLYDDFFGGKCPSYSIQVYENEDDGSIYSKTDIKDLHEIKKAIPMHRDDDGELLSWTRFWRGKCENTSYEDIDLVMKSRLNYGKALGKWKREEELYQLIKKVYKKYNVIYQYKPLFLKNPYGGQQSIDIYIEDIKIGIEYQGKQHYEAISIFGGDEGLLQTQLRDRRKLDKCTENGVKVVYIKYDEKFSQKMIKEKIEKAILEDITIQNKEVG